jgi:hypothetical protein
MIRLGMKLLPLALTLVVASCGVYGPKGNDTGGIIPWSPEAEYAAMAIAHDNCARFGKHPRITSIRRNYGDYIAYVCVFDRGPYVVRSTIERAVISVKN